MSRLVNANAEDATMLTDLIVKSEEHWGYDADYLKKFRVKYRITEELIGKNPTYIYKDGNEVIGFFCLSHDGLMDTLEYFYLALEYIGKGYGTVLWNELIKVCKNRGIEELSFSINPEAEGFYVSRGAVVIGEVASIIKKNRILPKLYYKID